MKFKRILLPVALSLFVLGAGCSLTQTVKVENKNQNTNTVQTNQNTNTAADTVSYKGQDGKNALELLQANHHVDVSDQGFVNAIDGKKPGDRQYWAFYVNNKLAEVGAKDYQSKTTDTIDWKLESY